MSEGTIEEGWVTVVLGFLNRDGASPFGLATQLRVHVDSGLLHKDIVRTAAAGTWTDNFGAAPIDIVSVAGGVFTRLKHT